MFLYKRNGICYIHYFDESENREKRVSSKCRIKQDALKFLSNIKNDIEEKKQNQIYNTQTIQI